MTITQAKRAACELLGNSACVERYPAKKTTAFGITHVASAQFMVGRTNRIGGVEVMGRGLSWEEALENASRRIHL